MFGIISIIFVAIFGWWIITTDFQGVEAKAQAEKEQCIVLKHQKEAQKSLEQDCGRYVNYNK